MPTKDVKHLYNAKATIRRAATKIIKDYFKGNFPADQIITDSEVMGIGRYSDPERFDLFDGNIMKVWNHPDSDGHVPTIDTFSVSNASLGAVNGESIRFFAIDTNGNTVMSTTNIEFVVSNKVFNAYLADMGVGFTFDELHFAKSTKLHTAYQIAQDFFINPDFDKDSIEVSKDKGDDQDELSDPRVYQSTAHSITVVAKRDRVIFFKARYVTGGTYSFTVPLHVFEDYLNREN